MKLTTNYYLHLSTLLEAKYIPKAEEYMMQGKFYIEHDLEVNGRKIKLLGIHHGQIPFAPIGLLTRKMILKKHDENPKATIYSEGVSRAYLPGKLTRKAKELSAGSLQEYLSKTKAGGMLRPWVFPLAIADAAIYSSHNYIRELAHLPKEIKPDERKEKYARSGWKDYKLFFKKNVSPAEQREAINYLIVYMSAKMAERLAVAPEQNIIAVMGWAHTALIKKFLENPKLRKRYLAMSIKKFIIFNHTIPEL